MLLDPKMRWHLGGHTEVRNGTSLTSNCRREGNSLLFVCSNLFSSLLPARLFSRFSYLSTLFCCQASHGQDSYPSVLIGLMSRT